MSFITKLTSFSKLTVPYPLKKVVDKKDKDKSETEEQFKSRLSVEYSKRKSGSGLFIEGIFDEVCMYI